MSCLSISYLERSCTKSVQEHPLITSIHYIVKYLTAWIFVLLSLAGLPKAFSADESKGYLLMFRPQNVQFYDDMPADLAKKYPHHRLLMVTFQPVTHPAAKDGSNLKEGEGSWLDRGMKPSEPGKLRLLLPEDDQMLAHTLRVAEGPFAFHVRNTGKGYLETVPLVAPRLEFAR
jgi:hypothetical protein